MPGNAKLLYFELLALFNEAYWPESLQVDNRRLMSLVDTGTERVAISARDKLVDAGFISYRKGKKGSPNTYHLLKYTPQKVSEFDSKSDSVSGSESVGELCSHIKTKDKDKDDILPPDSGKNTHAPAQGSGVIQRPTFEQVLEFAKSRSAEQCARPFFDYYDAAGWRDGQNAPVYSWRQKFITWQMREERQQKKDGKKKAAGTGGGDNAWMRKYIDVRDKGGKGAVFQ